MWATSCFQLVNSPAGRTKTTDLPSGDQSGIVGRVLEAPTVTPPMKDPSVPFQTENPFGGTGDGYPPAQPVKPPNKPPKSPPRSPPSAPWVAVQAEPFDVM